MLLRSYEWSRRTATRHRGQIRSVFGFREFSRADEDRLAGWLAAEVFEYREAAVREDLLDRVRSEWIEPPGRVSRLLGRPGRLLSRHFARRCSGEVVD